MSFEKTIKGNPHQFTIQQHFHSAHAIEKFHDLDQQVDVFNLKSQKTKRLGKKANIFCTQRNWDQKTETGIMARIEDQFHEEINNLKVFESRNHSAITEYFLLWRIRYNFHISRMKDETLIGIEGSGLDKKTEEILESKGAMYIRDGGIVPGRFMTGIQVVMKLDYQRDIINNLKWGLLTATCGEFIVADCYNELMFMPISPNLAFCANYKDIDINKESVADANKQSIDMSTEFYFAKNLALCPIA